MGGRGGFHDFKAAAYSGIIILAGIVKTKIGEKRDRIKAKVNKVLTSSFKKEFVDKNTGRKVKMTVKTTTDGNDHISNNILKGDGVSERRIHQLGKLFEEAEYHSDNSLYKSRSDNRIHFYYFKHPKKKLYFHVAKKEYVMKNKRKRYIYELYSITKDLKHIK
jgi:copper homeostasis protein CutC